MSEIVVAYIPVLHEGYRRFLDAHARERRLFVVGPSLYADYRPLAKDIRCLDAELIAKAISSWEVCAEVSVLDQQGAMRLAAEAPAPAITMPAEDVSYQLVERFFSRCEVRFDTVFLRWDKTRTVQLLVPEARPATPEDEALAEIVASAEAEADSSVDWWRRVGAAIRFSDGTIASAHNEHEPHRLSAYVAGDPRSNFYKGVGFELSSATHAEARLIAQAARDGTATAGAEMYVTDFPCPPCAKLIAGAGISRLYFRGGYAVLDGQQVLESAGVDLIQVN